MLEKLADPRYQAIARPCEHAIDLVTRVVADTPEAIVCEVGIGIGATSLEICRTLDHRGQAWFFDYADRLAELATDLTAAGFTNFRTFGNSRRTFDSYAWNLAVLLRQTRDRGTEGLFDFVYLDGAHTFHHDAPATVCLKDLLKVGGYILMDDYDWTIAISPTMRPSVNPAVEQHYTDEQIELSHVEMVCSLFLDPDPRFVPVPIGYRGREHRRAYRRIA
jgi:predicted O-methyltransferase YrrM